MSAADAILSQCNVVQDLRAQAEPMKALIAHLEVQVGERYQRFIHYESEFSGILDQIARLSAINDHVRERIGKFQADLKLTNESLAQTSHRLSEMRENLTSLPLAMEEQRLLDRCYDYLGPETLSNPSAPPSSAESSEGMAGPTIAPELQEYYKAAGWVGIWKERIEDLRFQHATTIGQKAGYLLTNEAAFNDSAQMFYDEEAGMLRELDTAKENARICLQRCQSNGVLVPHQLSPSTVTSSGRSMSAVDLREGCAHSPTRDFSDEPPSPTLSFLDDALQGTSLNQLGLATSASSAANAILSRQISTSSMSHSLEADPTKEAYQVSAELDHGHATGGAVSSAALDPSATTSSLPSALADREASHTYPLGSPSSSNRAKSQLTTGQDADHPRRIKTMRWQENEDTFLDVRDPANDLRILMQVTPRQKITDPELLQEGILAEGKLLPTEGTTEKLFANYRRRKHPSCYFVIGRVFFVLWAEPATEQSMTGFEIATHPDQYGEDRSVYSRVRRFVVIQEGIGYCSCLPITTYNNRGVSKEGVVKFHHSIIYTTSKAPEPTKDELPRPDEDRGMQPTPIQVKVADPSDKLAALSRLDYGKFYTIHHNCKVRHFGEVHSSSLPSLKIQFSIVSSAIASTRAYHRHPSREDSITPFGTSSGTTGPSLPALHLQADRMDAGERAALERMRVRGFTRTKALEALRFSTSKQSVSPIRRASPTEHATEDASEHLSAAYQ